MKRYAGVVFALSLLIALPAYAQRQGGGGRGPGGGMMGGGRGMGAMLLGSPQVQEELKLTDEQKSKIDEIMGKVREEMQGLREKFQDAPDEARKAMTEISEKSRAEVTKLLKEEQTKRFEQIELQARGVEAFADAKVQEALKITDEQKTKITAAIEELNTKRREIMQDAQGDFQAAMTKARELQTSVKDKVTALLDEAQKTKLKEMMGAPFELRFGGPGGPGGPGGGRRQPN